MISGKDTYKVHITDFQSIDFSNAHQIKNILGIEDDQMSGINIVKQYPVKDTASKALNQLRDFRSHCILLVSLLHHFNISIQSNQVFITHLISQRIAFS